MRLALGGVRRTQLPSFEAVPPELVGRADLIRETEGVDPALLLRSPTAVPGKLDDTDVATALNCHGSDEIRASRARVDLKAIDHPFRVRVEQLIDESDHLDARNSPHQRDRRGLSATREGEDICLESISRAGTAENGGVDWHAGNISGCRRIRAPFVSVNETKLTAESARVWAR